MDFYDMKELLGKYESLNRTIYTSIPKLIPNIVQECFNEDIFHINQIKLKTVTVISQQIFKFHKM